MTSTETKWLFDCLLKLTVGSVLFPEPLKRVASVSSTGNDHVSSPRLLQEQSVAGDDGGSHYESVMECQHWTDQELQAEKRLLKRYLRERRSQVALKQETVEQEHAQLYRLYEAYALLKLFLAERRRQKQEDAPEAQAKSLLLVQAQLLLYAKYFEKARQRQIRSDDDIRPVRSLYELFCGHSQQQQ